MNEVNKVASGNDEARQSKSDRNIKQMLQDNEYIIVVDTNILLKIYRSSPDYADYVLRCLEEIKDYVYIPYNVLWEYEKHKTNEYSKKKKSIENTACNCTDIIVNMKNKIEGQCAELSKHGYPQIEEISITLKSKMEEIENIFEGYFESHQDLEYLNEWAEDRVSNLCNFFKRMPEPQASFIYKQCKEGEFRYKQNIPPGYKDNKKDGVSKYGDLIVWAETYTFASTNQKNIIFVTDDVKEDWWEKSENGTLLFRKELIKEFKRKTIKSNASMESLIIIPFTGYDFYSNIARDYNIDMPDAVELALDATDEAFVEAVSDLVFDDIWEGIAYSGV